MFFGAKANTDAVKIGQEHLEYGWFPPEKALKLDLVKESKDALVEYISKTATTPSGDIL